MINLWLALGAVFGTGAALLSRARVLRGPAVALIFLSGIFTALAIGQLVWVVTS